MAQKNTAPSRAASIDIDAMPEEALLLPAETAAELRVSTTTLANWRWETRRGNPKGPEFVTLSEGLVRYKVRAVRRFRDGVTP